MNLGELDIGHTKGIRPPEYGADRLLEVSGYLAFFMDEEQILNAVLREVSDTKVDRCVIAVFEDVEDRDPQWLEVVAVYDRESGELGLEPAPRRFQMDDMPMIQELLHEKELLIFSDLTPRTGIGSPFRERFTLNDMATVAIVPFIVMGWPIGMLVVGRRTLDEFSPPQLRFYQVVANLAAMALRAVHLIEGQKRRMAEQNAANRVGRAISRTIHLDELLELVYEQINTVIDARDFYIALYDPFHDEVSFPFAMEQGERQQWADREAGQGLTEYVLRTREPLLLVDRVRERIQSLGIEAIGAESLSWMGAPLCVGEKVIGAIGVQNFERENAYDQADLDLLASLANQVAVAIENARLYDQVRYQATHLRLSAEVGQRIVLILDIDELLSQVVELIRESFGYYHVHVALVDERAGRLVYRVGSSDPRVSLSGELPRPKVGEEGIIGWVAGRGEPLLVNDVHTDPRYLHLDALPDTRSELAVPIRFGGKIIGVLDVESDVRNAFHPQDIIVMYTLADYIAVAIENARLFSEQKRRIQELDILAGIGQALSRSTSRAQLLELVCEQIGKLIDVSNLFVALYYPQEATVHLEMAYEEGERLEPFTLHYDAGEGLTSWVIENRRPLLINDWDQDDMGMADRVVKRGAMDARSWLGVPMTRFGQMVGVIGVQSAVPGAFDERHQAILTFVAAQLGMALANPPA